MGTLLTLVYWWMTELLESHLDQSVQQALSVLTDDLEQDGRRSMIGLVHAHARGELASPLHLSVTDSQGQRIAGDLPLVESHVGWQYVALSGEAHGGLKGSHRLRALGTQIDADTFVLVAHETTDLLQTQQLLVRSFVIAVTLTVLIALLGGLWIGATLVRRVEVVDQTARAIMDGDLSQRIPVVGPADELHGLAEIINLMLTRIEQLMSDVRHVTSNIAHDLRSPLGRLQLGLETAALKARDSTGYESALGAASKETQSILRTFDAMLRIAEIEAGALRSRMGNVNLSAVVEVVHDAFAPVVEDDGRRLELETHGDLVTHGDRELITQMIVNLVENANRHTPPGTCIMLEAMQLGQSPAIVVADDGPGIPAEARERATQRFFRLDSSRSTPGRGLGLSFVAAVARLHKASLTLDDNRPGLRVILEFPLDT